MKTHRFSVAVSVVALLALSLGSSFAQLIGCDIDANNIYDINTSTGAASNPRRLGATSLVGIAYQASSGNLYGLTSLLGSPANSLVRIDPTTGATVIIGPTGLSHIFEGDLAFNPVSGVLYGLYDVPIIAPQLFKINVATGAATPVATIIAPNYELSAMAFDAAGVLYVLNTGPEVAILMVMNANGGLIRQVQTNRHFGEDAGMAFDPATGIAYVADGGPEGARLLYTLNTTTGVLTPVGSLLPAGGISGLTFLSAPVAAPEGGSGAALLACGIIALAVARRHKYRAATAYPDHGAGR